jgi:hypothetical protein
MTARPGKTTRMIEYAIAAARQGRTLAIIAANDDHRARLYKTLREAAKAAGCAWVVGNGDNGDPAGNIDVYSALGNLVFEDSPGAYGLRGDASREILVDNHTLEQKYQAALDHYLRWL